MNSSFKRDIINELYKLARRHYPRRRTIVNELDDLWQADLIEVIPYARENGKNMYILIVIDCFSKYVWALQLKSKAAAEVARCMKNILQRSKTKPNHLQTDVGKEFYNRNFARLMTTHCINHYSTYSTVKVTIEERVVRTIKKKLYREFSIRE